MQCGWVACAPSVRRARTCVAIALMAGLAVGCSSAAHDADPGTAGLADPAPDRSQPAQPTTPVVSAEPSATAQADSSEAGSDGAAGPAATTEIARVLEPSADCVHPPVERSCRDGLCTIGAGCFVMGAPRSSVTAARYSNVQVEVRLSRSFAIGETEVTRAQWLAVGLPEPRVDWQAAFRTTAPDVAPPGQDLCLEADCPVTWVSFEDAAAYANLRSEAQGLPPCYALSECERSAGQNMRCRSVRVNAASPYECTGYRLPTEAEWELAARAGTRSDIHAGDLDPLLDPDSTECPKLDRTLDGVGWYCGNSGELHRAGTGRPHRVAQKQANGFGLYDVAGNVFEWVNDRFEPAGYGEGPHVDPVFGVADPRDLTPGTPVFEGMPDGNFVDGFPGFRVRRGGAFDLWSQSAGAATRDYSYMGTQHAGFRIVRSLP